MNKESFGISAKQESVKEHDPEVQKVFNELSTIAQIVGGDFGMQVKIGEVGRGSYYDPTTVSITMDPDHLIRNPNEAKFVIAHEGGHRAITRSPLQLGVSKEIVNELYSKPGFGFIQNAIEDPADNDWFSKKFPGLKSYTKEVYDKQFADENATLLSPEIMDYAKELGFMPKFAKFGSEVIRHWHQDRYANNLDPEVFESLKKTESFVKQSISEIPKSDLSEDEVIEKARIRFKINTEEVWPSVEKLLEYDIKNAKRNEALNDIKEKLKKNKESKHQGQEDQNVEGLNNESPSNPNQVSDNSKTKENINSLSESFEEGGFSEEELTEIESKFNIQKSRFTGKQNHDTKEITDQLTKHEQIIEELGEKLDNYIRNLPTEERQNLEERAKQKLENLEDALNKQLESKLNKEKLDNHEEKRKEKNQQEQKEREKKDEDRQRKEQEQKIEEMRRSLMTPYERYRSEVAGMIDNLYYRLKRVLKPDDFGKEEFGHSRGQTLDMVRVMQSEYDFNQKTKLWIKEEMPESKDYRFMNLIDMSSSMSGNPIEEVFKGFVVVGEAVDRLEDFNSEKIQVHQAIKGFHDRVFDYKDFNQRFSEKVEEGLAKIVENTNGGTDTYLGTINALESIDKNLGKTGNFILTFTDGEPNRDAGEKLKSFLKNNREERKKKKIRVGLVWLNKASDSELKEMIDEYGYDFGLILETSKNKAGKDFSEKLGDVIEDIIENPQKY